MNRTKMPFVSNAVEMNISLPEIECNTLSNGIPLYYYTSKINDIFSLDLAFPIGTWVEDKRLQFFFLAKLLKQGTKRHSAKDFNEWLEYYGASVSINYTYESFTINVSGLTKFLGEILPFILDMLTQPIFSVEEFENIRSRSKQNMAINLKKSDYVANQFFDAMIYGYEHPYGMYSKLENYDSITLEDIIQIYSQFIKFGNLHLFLSGNIKPQHIQKISQVFGELNAETYRLPTWNYIVQPTSNAHQNIIINEKAMQSVICVGKEIVQMDHPDFYAVVLFNVVLGGYFGSRLMSNIREDKGYTYGIYSSVTPYNKSSILKINTDVNKDVAADTIHQIYHEINVLSSELISNEELLTVKNYLMSLLLGQLDGPLQIMKKWKNLILSGYGKARFDESVEAYKYTTAEDLQRIAQTYFHEDTMMSLIVS